MPASSTVLVSSSTNSGLPSVLTTVCSVTSAGSIRPPVTRTTMLWTLERWRRPSVKVLTLGRPTHGGPNSGRKGNTASTGRTRRAECLESALGIGHALDRPRRGRLRNTPDLVPAEVTQTKQIAEQAARGGGDDDRPGLGQGLKSGCKVRRLPHDSVLPQRTLAAK